MSLFPQFVIFKIRSGMAKVTEIVCACIFLASFIQIKILKSIFFQIIENIHIFLNFFQRHRLEIQMKSLHN